PGAAHHPAPRPEKPFYPRPPDHYHVPPSLPRVESPMQIGPYTLANNLVLAPMAGVTDRPFRQLCKQLGAGLVVSEMVTADTRLWHSRKSRHRLDHNGEPGPISVQIA